MFGRDKKKGKAASNNLEGFKQYTKELKRIRDYEFSQCDEEEIFNVSDKLRHKAKKEKLEEILPAAYALVKEVTRRTLQLELFDEQLIAAVALHHGNVIEMETGEGKTLAAVLPAYLNSLKGEGVHILTFNDYLAKRDANWMKPIYDMLGVTVGYITEETSKPERKEMYACDITYVSAKEAGFDYLRDFMANDKEIVVQRGFHYAIVDEADSILIDEARIPLVIAGNIKRDNQLLKVTNSITDDFLEGEDFTLNKYAEKVSLTDQGLEKAEQRLDVENLYSEENTEILEVLLAVLYAKYVLKQDKDYIIRNGDIEIVDEFTGRVADRRQYPDALQDAVRIKENIISDQKSMVLNSIPLQHYQSLYQKLSGMTGTVHPAENEFWEYYDLKTIRIEPHKPCIREDLPDHVFDTKQNKLNYLIQEISEIHKTGQPILIGTGSVMESEELYQALQAEGIPCHVLNAKNDEQEAQIIKNAGIYGAVTVSTNMAGRGVDIRLGGSDQKDYERVAELGGLFVIGTNRNESRRIDNQLRGRSGRQGDPGMSRFYVSLEDDMMVKYDIRNFLPDKYSVSEEGIIQDKKVKEAVAWLQRRVESYNESARIQLLKYTYVLEQQRQIIHDRCMDILFDRKELTLLQEKCKEKYTEVLEKFGAETVKKAERDLTLYHIRKSWAEYIDYMEYEKEGIHLVLIGRKDPVDEYNRIAVDTFVKVQQEIEENIVQTFLESKIEKDGIDLVSMGLEVPAATWTYLINENKSQFASMESFVKFITGKFKEKD